MLFDHHRRGGNPDTDDDLIILGPFPREVLVIYNQPAHARGLGARRQCVLCCGRGLCPGVGWPNLTTTVVALSIKLADHFREISA